ncbi:hypothetical protein AX16_003775 [Volvariella volvacea WC 439]|nr:hypothetical protein AX16_003775 [Volvariella volvacea WC 439]
MTSRNASRTSLISQYELIPTPSHRHASPSAPWPWMDIGDEVDPEQLNTELPPVPSPCDHSSCGDHCWMGYPQSRFPNWTPQQVKRSGIADIIDAALDEVASKIYHVDIQDDGFFVRGRENLEEAMYSDRELWEKILELEPPEGTRLRALFVEEMSSRVLRMLGAKYNIEPFFFSSSINWIPSLYQENPRPGKGDHITVTMTFLRCRTIQDDAAWAHVLHLVQSLGSSTDSLSQQVINTKAPLPLRESKRVLMLDLLSVHLIRSQSGSIMISYHPKRGQYSTSAAYLRDRLQFAGRSVYWQHIFRDYEDPTFVLLVVLWHAVYAWDEALEALYQHICHMEGSAIKASDMGLTQQLHIVRAHLLHYSSLLDDFKKTIEFVHQTPHLVKDERIGPRVEGYLSPDEVMDRECKKLLKEIGRLKDGIGMQDQRSKNVINLVYSRVNIQDSHLMMEMTQAAVRDSAAVCGSLYYGITHQPSSRFNR